MIFVSVGTYVNGFDELISSMDNACRIHQLNAFAQIGNSSEVPTRMQYQRFLTSAEMSEKISKARLVVCHGGFGIIGDAMRENRPIIAVPRRNPMNSSENPANDQTFIVQRLRLIFGIEVCENSEDLVELLPKVLSESTGLQRYDLSCNVPDLIIEYCQKHNFV